MHAYVINLKRAVIRREHMVAQLSRSGVSYQFVEAHEGRELDLDDPRVVDPSVLADGTLSPGGVGCALSHLDAYRMIVEDGRQRALVLEDDAVLPPGLDGVVEEIAAGMTGAEIVVLRVVARYGTAPLQCSTWGARTLRTSRRVVHPYHIEHMLSAGAYLVTREAAERMAEVILPVRAHADLWAHFHALGAIDSVRCVVPALVPAEPRFRSTIERYAPNTLQGRVRRHVGNHPVPLLSPLLTARRRRRQRKCGQTVFVEVRPPWLAAQAVEPGPVSSRTS